MITPSARLLALPGYPLAELPSIKKQLIAAGRDIIDVAAGDNDTPPPRLAIDALKAAIEKPSNSKYGFQQGHPEFRRAASDYVRRRFGKRFDPATETLPLIGSKEGLAHMPFAFLNVGDVAVMPEPGYQAYLGGTVSVGADPYVVPLREENGFLLDIDSVPADVLRRTRLLFLNYPNNPTAAVAPMAYLERVVAACRKHQIVLAYDSAYCDIVFDGYRAPSIFEIRGAHEVAVEFFSLSKSFSMTGWRIAFAVGESNLIAPLTTAKSYKDTGPFLAVQEAAAAVLDQAEALIPPICAEIGRRRDAAVPALRAAGFRVALPKAAMYLWVALPRGISSKAFARHALEAEGVMVLPGSAFGPAGEGYFRIALTVPPARLEEAVGRLSKALASVQEAGGGQAA
jgi:LL-diaminopimelate aminotransferase